MHQFVEKDSRLTTGTERQRCFKAIVVPMCLCAFFLLCFVSCGVKQSVAEKTFSVRGVVKEVEAAKKTVTVQHEKIPGYMDAMTMPFEVKNTNELRGLKVGDRIAFQMVVAEKEGWIRHIVKLDQSPEQMPSRTSVQVVKAIEPLDPGEPVPDFHLTNELGQAISLADLKGKAFAMTFIFTSCPFPNFCPRMTSNFSETENKLIGQKGAPTNWMLLSVSFDPEHDSPEKLLAYGKVQNYDPAHWHFLTGSEAEIEQLCEVFDEKFWHDGTSISHNLRTVVVGADGKLQKIFQGNDWTSDELKAELLKACKPSR